jgi:hypothetical protein
MHCRRWNGPLARLRVMVARPVDQAAETYGVLRSLAEVSDIHNSHREPDRKRAGGLSRR